MCSDKSPQQVFRTAELHCHSDGKGRSTEEQQNLFGWLQARFTWTAHKQNSSITEGNAMNSVIASGNRGEMGLCSSQVREDLFYPTQVLPQAPLGCWPGVLGAFPSVTSEAACSGCLCTHKVSSLIFLPKSSRLYIKQIFLSLVPSHHPFHRCLYKNFLSARSLFSLQFSFLS